MLTKRISFVATACLFCFLTACGPQDLDNNPIILDDSEESLAQALPPELLQHNNPRGQMLPASMTAGEKQGKADGYDQRDNNALYQFTNAPTDVVKMPGEFEAPLSMMVGWPGGTNEFAPMFAQILAESTSEFAKTMVFTPSTTAARELSLSLNDLGADTSKISFVKTSLDTIWMRDFGPLVVKTTGNSRRIIDMRYYYGRFDDDALPTRLAKAWKMPVSRPPLEQEGGNFQSDGAGTCISSDGALEKNVSRHYTGADLQRIYHDYFGCQTTLILPRLDGEGTGHIDMYVMITGPKEALVGQYTVKDDPVNAKIVDKGASMLTAAGFKVRRIPMPTNQDGAYRSYTNGLAIGKKVLVPIYGDDRRYEAQALQAYQEAYPERTIVPVDSTDVIQWAGAVHCVTMTIND